MSSNAEKYLLHLFYRPTEPVFMVKDEKVWFDVPPRFLIDRFKNLKITTPPVPLEAVDFVNGKPPFHQPILHFKVEDFSGEPPDLTEVLKVGRDQYFSTFIPLHRKSCNHLVKILMENETVENLISAAAYCRDRVNPYLFNYALSLTILNHPRTIGLQLPPLYQVFPGKFFTSDVLLQARKEAILPKHIREPVKATPIIVYENPYKTASNVNMEHRLAYFREDLGINLHHWHWHLVYPHSSPYPSMLNRDRRGELFYYMHQQVLARYNTERLCNELNFVNRFMNWKEDLMDGYFPKLDSHVASINWPGRSDNSMLRDLNRPDNQIDVQDLERWRSRILSAIHRGFVIDSNGNRKKLDEKTGIDILGNIVEASDLSINHKLYGDIHNLGHLMICLCHDPEGRHLESFGVMGDIATAMRDPIFYRWHAFIDYIFQEHKNVLSPYTDQELLLPDVVINSVRIVSKDSPVNQLTTYWETNVVDMSKGLDFVAQGPVCVQVKYLQHLDFTYEIEIESYKHPRDCNVRIFLAPKYNDRGDTMTFSEQRHFFIEMDKFSHHVTKKVEVIARDSSKSSVTIPYDQIFRYLDIGTVDPVSYSKVFCGCGWPDYMLVPKGTAEGFPCCLFVMITDFDEDSVSAPPLKDANAFQRDPSAKPDDCVEALSYCGLRDRKYPDKRALGFPFDRNASDFKTFLKPNMSTAEVKIVHKNETKKRNDKEECVK